MGIPVTIPGGALPITDADNGIAESLVAALGQIMQAGSTGATITTPATLVPNGVNPPASTPEVPYIIDTAEKQLFFRQLGLALAKTMEFYKQSIFKEIVVDTTTTSTSFVDLLSQNITMDGGTELLVRFMTSCDNTVATNSNYFRLTVDGTVIRGCGMTSSGAGSVGSTGLTARVTGLAAGVHVVKIQWAVEAGTGEILPTSNPNSESASLLLEEVAA